MSTHSSCAFTTTTIRDNMHIYLFIYIIIFYKIHLIYEHTIFFLNIYIYIYIYICIINIHSTHTILDGINRLTALNKAQTNISS